MKTIKIPTSHDPFIVEINNKVYSYKAGITASVPDEVASVIEQYNNLLPVAVGFPEAGAVLTADGLGGTFWKKPEGPGGKAYIHKIDYKNAWEQEEMGILYEELHMSFVSESNTPIERNDEGLKVLRRYMYCIGSVDASTSEGDFGSRVLCISDEGLVDLTAEGSGLSLNIIHPEEHEGGTITFSDTVTEI